MLNTSDKLLSYDGFREINDYYDDCLRVLSDTDVTEPFERALVYCRLHSTVEGFKNYSIIDFLRYLSKLDYHQFLVDAQPKQAEIIKRYASIRSTSLSLIVKQI